MDPNELYQQYLFWRHAGLEPIIAIDGFTTFFLEGHLGKLTKEQQKIIRSLQHYSQMAIQGWNDFGEFLQAEYHLEQETEQHMFLPEVIDRAVDLLRKAKYLGINESIRVKMPEPLTLVRINPLYERVFFYLLAPSYKLKDESHFIPEILVKESIPGKVGIQIQSGIAYFSIPDRPIYNLYPSTDIILANKILQQKGIALQVEIVNGEREPLTVVNFEFAIPISVDVSQEPDQKESP